MSINHFSTDSQETPWWQHPQQQQQLMETTAQNSSGSSSSHTNPQHQFSPWPNSPHQFYHHQLWLNSSNNNNNNDENNSDNPTLSFNEQRELEDQQMTNKNTNTNEEHELEFAKEPMFEKPLTPSDVGKLNRLVIPKQHAEKYFPLGGGGDSSGSDKGLLLSFEDESGKCWRFRYSYWNSSQSYVLTKGWSRWRRRGATAAQDAQSAGAAAGRGLYSNHPYPVVTVPLYQHAGSVVQSQTTSIGSSKTFRLFGVNLECQLDEAEGSELGHQQFNYSPEAYTSTNRHNHMEITFSQEDENQMMRNRQG